tara:strand:- start:1840 stop:2187 length:348 start_codon:yes stop_codon:yes gene_type:complete
MDVSFFWVINQLIISITFIFIIHHIFHVFKKNLTIPKTKDLVKKPIEQYKQIYEDIDKFKDNENDIMKNELAEYVKSLAKNHNQNITQPPTNSTNNFSNINEVGGGFESSMYSTF